MKNAIHPAQRIGQPKTPPNILSRNGGLSPILRKLLAPNTRPIFSGVYGRLFASAGLTPPGTVLVCSASEGEGATTVAAGLAVAASEKKSGQILLIDGNFHRPAICKIFGMANGNGLGELLSGDTNADVPVKKTTIPYLSVMGAGSMAGDHIRAMEPPKFRNLLQEFLSTYQLLILDGPSINAHPESVFYAPQVDRVLLVVHSGVARAPVVASAIARLSAVGSGSVEVVLNRRTYAIPKTIYAKL